jgi:polyisoprenoid-binding protein YceI
VWVNVWSGPAEAVAGAPIELRVRGAFPTAGWRIIGYGVTLEPGQANAPTDRLPRIVVTPWAAEPTGGAAAAQVITHFDERCALFVGQPGRYALEVRGRARAGVATVLRELDVRPAALLVSLATSGGLTGATRRIEVLRDGRLRGERGTRLLSLPRFFALADAVDALPRASHEQLSTDVADVVTCELAWARDGVSYTARFDDLTQREPWRGVIEALLALDRPDAAQPAGPPRWTIDPAQGSFTVETGTAGLLASFGHDHRFAVRDFAGTLLFDPALLEAAALELVVQAGSLALTGDVDEDDRAEIEANAHGEALEVGRHPTVVFTTRSVAAKHLGDQRWEAVLTGDLALHGRIRAQRVHALVEVADDVLRAKGKLHLSMSDFGIEPPSAAAGTIQVADRIDIVFDLVARRAP